MKIASLFLSLIAFATTCVAQTDTPAPPAANPYNLPDGLYSEITTPRGVVVCELFYKKTPMTVASYVGLAEGSLGPAPRKPFFETSTFHRIVPGYVAQTGAARPGGRGRSGYQFPDEFVPGLRHDSAGVLQMANSGPGTNGSQHCLMLGPAQRLNYLHTVFGRVVRGLEVLPNIELNDTMRVKIWRLGAEAQAFQADEAAFNALVAQATTVEGPFESGPRTHFYDPDGLLPTQIPRATHFNMKLMNFERFTGQRIFARLYAESPPGSSGLAFVEHLDFIARGLGVEQSGAFAAYFADQDRWYVLVRPESAESFIAGPRKPDGTKAPVGPGKTLEQATQEFLAVTKEQAAKLIEAAQQAPPPNDSVAPAQKRKLQVDVLLDELIFRLEPAAETPDAIVR